jgi:hypothetical protein
VAKAANAAAAIQRRETAADELVAVGTTQSAPPAASDEPMCCEPCPVDTTPETDPVAPKNTGIDGKPWCVTPFSALEGFSSPIRVLLPSAFTQKLTKRVLLVRAVNRRDPTLQRGAKRWTDQVRRDTHYHSFVILFVHHVRV